MRVNVLDGTFVASQSITRLRRSCLPCNVKALLVNLPVSVWVYIMILDGNMRRPCFFSVYNTYASRGVVDVCCQIFLPDFNPQ